VVVAFRTRQERTGLGWDRQPRTILSVLTHDSRFDVPPLEVVHGRTWHTAGRWMPDQQGWALPYDLTSVCWIPRSEVIGASSCVLGHTEVVLTHAPPHKSPAAGSPIRRRHGRAGQHDPNQRQRGRCCVL